MTTFKALLVLRNANPVCQSSLQELAGPCRDRMLLSKRSLVTQVLVPLPKDHEKQPRAGLAALSQEGNAWLVTCITCPQDVTCITCPRAPGVSPPSTNTALGFTFTVKVTGGTHLLWNPQPGSSADKKQKRAFKPQTVQSQIRDPWSYQGVISKLGRSL